MSSKSGLEDCLEIHSKLFNHRPFIQTEIKNFVREFETKRGDREVDSVFSCLERVSELRDIGLPQLSDHVTSPVTTNLLANLQVRLFILKISIIYSSTMNNDIIQHQVAHLELRSYTRKCQFGCYTLIYLK